MNVSTHIEEDEILPLNVKIKPTLKLLKLKVSDSKYSQDRNEQTTSKLI